MKRFFSFTLSSRRSVLSSSTPNDDLGEKEQAIAWLEKPIRSDLVTEIVQLTGHNSVK